MEEKNVEFNENIEEEILNNEIDNDRVYTKAEVEAIKKEMQSNSDKGVQKILREKKDLETYTKEISKISNDDTRLIDLFDENPRVAQMILDEYYNGESIEDYKERIAYTEDYTDPKIVKQKIQQEAKKLTEQNLIEAKKEAFIEKLEMSEGEKEAFIDSFEEIRTLKSFDIKNINKQFEKAYRLSNDNEGMLQKLKQNEVIGKNIGLSENKGTNTQTSKPKNNDIVNFLQDFGIIN